MQRTLRSLGDYDVIDEVLGKLEYKVKCVALQMLRDGPVRLYSFLRQFEDDGYDVKQVMRIAFRQLVVIKDKEGWVICDVKRHSCV